MNCSFQHDAAQHKIPPISKVTVNKNTVIFMNNQGQQKVEFQSSTQRKMYLQWLLS